MRPGAPFRKRILYPMQTYGHGTGAGFGNGVRQISAKGDDTDDLMKKAAEGPDEVRDGNSERKTQKRDPDGL